MSCKFRGAEGGGDSAPPPGEKVWSAPEQKRPLNGHSSFGFVLNKNEEG